MKYSLWDVCKVLPQVRFLPPSPGEVGGSRGTPEEVEGPPSLLWDSVQLRVGLDHGEGVAVDASELAQFFLDAFSDAAK